MDIVLTSGVGGIVAVAVVVRVDCCAAPCTAFAVPLGAGFDPRRCGRRSWGFVGVMVVVGEAMTVGVRVTVAVAEGVAVAVGVLVWVAVAVAVGVTVAVDVASSERSRIRLPPAPS